MKKLVILGSTGSIGMSALDVVRRHPDKLKVTGLSAGSNIACLVSQVEEFRPSFVAIRDSSAAHSLREAFPSLMVFSGEGSSTRLVEETPCDIVLAAISGMAGLSSVLAAARRGLNIALANKEALVAAGELLLAEVRSSGARLLPVDSEHSAIWQAMHGWDKSSVQRLILTASGGPFFGKSRVELEGVTAEQALSHPTWKMGGKISIDSATLMNKGLEVIEAHHLFGVDYSCIEVLVHPQSIVHSIVEYRDGSQLAQCSRPDMRIPIQLALSYPDRWPAEYVDNRYHGMQWSFAAPDLNTFRCLYLAREAGRRGGSYPIALNAANEVAVDAFLAGRISFLRIAEVVEDVLSCNVPPRPQIIDEVFAADSWARSRAAALTQ